MQAATLSPAVDEGGAAPAFRSRAGRALECAQRIAADRDASHLMRALTGSRYVWYVGSFWEDEFGVFGPTIDAATLVIDSVASGSDSFETDRRNRPLPPLSPEERKRWNAERNQVSELVRALNGNPYAYHAVAWCMWGDERARIDIGPARDSREALFDLATEIATEVSDWANENYGP